MPGPIKPKEVQGKKNESIPEEVFEVINAMILEDWDGRSATVSQIEAGRRAAKVLGITTGELYKRKLLDIEDIYRKAGWKVEFDKPGYNESYEAHFIFKK